MAKSNPPSSSYAAFGVLTYESSETMEWLETDDLVTPEYFKESQIPFEHFQQAQIPEEAKFFVVSPREAQVLEELP